MQARNGCAAKLKFRKCAGFLWPQQSRKESSGHVACMGLGPPAVPGGSFRNVGTPSPLNSVYTRSGQNSTPNSNATNLHSSQKRCCSFCISSSNASPTFQVQKSIFHQMTKPIQVTVMLPLLLAISFSRNDDIHSSISGISNDLIGVIPTIGQ